MGDGNLAGKIQTANFTYTGTLQNGKQHGEGMTVFNNGRRHLGLYWAGKMCGQGRLEMENGDVYVGNFKANKQDGLGVLEFSDGSSYVGMFRNDCFDGIGNMKNRQGDKLLASWSQGEIVGTVEIHYANGELFEGAVKKVNDDFLPSGFGKFKGKNNVHYKGQWKEGSFHGIGVYIDASGDSYTGSYEMGVRKGRGRIRWKQPKDEWITFEGDVENGKPHGLGVLYSQDGKVFCGSFAEGIPHGPGRMTYADNTEICGLWYDWTGPDFLRYHGKDDAVFIGYCANFEPKFGTWILKNGRRKEVMYKRTGQKIWDNPKIQKSKQIQYEGSSDFFKIEEYDGILLSCENEAWKRANFDNGDSFEGEWNDGKPHGKGIYVSLFGNVIEGTWTEGELTGFVYIKDMNGESYEGNFLHGQYHGLGTKIGNGGYKYKGMWKNGKKHGDGVCFFSDASSYCGPWKDDLQHGEGRCAFPDLSSYEGDFDRGRLHGAGVFCSSDGWRFDGKFQNNKPTQGVMHHDNGSVFAVEYAPDCCDIWKSPLPIESKEISKAYFVDLQEKMNKCLFSEMMADSLISDEKNEMLRQEKKREKRKNRKKKKQIARCQEKQEGVASDFDLQDENYPEVLVCDEVETTPAQETCVHDVANLDCDEAEAGSPSILLSCPEVDKDEESEAGSPSISFVHKKHTDYFDSQADPEIDEKQVFSPTVSNVVASELPSTEKKPETSRLLKLLCLENEKDEIDLKPLSPSLFSCIDSRSRFDHFNFLDHCTGKLKEEDECVVCMENRRTHIITPCGHFCICQDCTTALQDGSQKHCPLCMIDIKEIYRVFS